MPSATAGCNTRSLTDCWDQWNPTSGVRDARREANGMRRSARPAASVIRHLRLAAAAEIFLRWMDGWVNGGGHGAGKDSSLSKEISEGLLRGGARYLEAELKEAPVNGGSDRDRIGRR
jgi:hypothetical protein